MNNQIAQTLVKLEIILIMDILINRIRSMQTEQTLIYGKIRTAFQTKSNRLQIVKEIIIKMWTKEIPDNKQIKMFN